MFIHRALLYFTHGAEKTKVPLKGRFPALDDVSFVFWMKSNHAEADRQRQSVRERAISRADGRAVELRPYNASRERPGKGVVN